MVDEIAKLRNRRLKKGQKTQNQVGLLCGEKRSIKPRKKSKAKMKQKPPNKDDQPKGKTRHKKLSGITAVISRVGPKYPYTLRTPGQSRSNSRRSISKSADKQKALKDFRFRESL